MKKYRNYLFILLCISFFVRLTCLSTPNEVIFDEVHWGKYTTAYSFTGQNLFDVHPPHGKLLVAALQKLTGYNGQQNFEKIGNPLTHISGITIRILPAICGALIPLFLFLILIEAQVSIELAFLFSLCSALDNALVLQSRVMGLYPMLLLALISSYYFAVKVKTSSSKTEALYVVLCGVASGFAVGFQFTGIAALAIVYFILGFREYKKLIAISLTALVIYFVGWEIHFMLLPNPGFGDAFYKNTGNFWTDFIALHGHMYRASAGLTNFHPDGSAPWSWPLMSKPIFYWSSQGRSLYFVGNPVIWWGVSFLFVLHTIKVLSNWRKIFSTTGLSALVAFFVSYLPLLLMKRVLFLYHYLTPLTYAIVFTGIIEKQWTKRKFHLGVLLIVLGFIFLSPVTYGWRMPDWYWNILPWKLAH